MATVTDFALSTLKFDKRVTVNASLSWWTGLEAENPRTYEHATAGSQHEHQATSETVHKEGHAQTNEAGSRALGMP